MQTSSKLLLIRKRDICLSRADKRPAATTGPQSKLFVTTKSRRSRPRRSLS